MSLTHAAAGRSISRGAGCSNWGIGGRDSNVQRVSQKVYIKSYDLEKSIQHVDDLIEDLDVAISQEEVDRLIAYENGKAMRIKIMKMDNSSFSLGSCNWWFIAVLVYKSATLNHLKLAIRDYIQRGLPEGKNQRISWYDSGTMVRCRKYIWRKYCLQCEDGKNMLDNRNYLKDFAIHDGSTLKMVVKPIIRKEKRQRQANQRKRFFNPNLLR